MENAMDMLERWVVAHQPLVYRAAWLILRDEAAAEDVAQEAFIRAYRAADRLEPGAEVRGWLYRIAVNTALNELRSRKRERTAVERLGDPPSASDPTDQRLTSSVVADAVDALPDRLRIPVILRYFLDMTEKEMATTLGIRPGTVKSRLHEARKLLADDDRMATAAGDAR